MASTYIPSGNKTQAVEIIYENKDDSSEEPDEELLSDYFEKPGKSIKRINYEKGLFDPGSGEICTKYIGLSASSVFRHPYYNYPAVVDPGIEAALLDPEPKIIYPDDGQKLYLSICEECELCPITSFHRQLLENEINLRYYGVQRMGFRAIAMALKLNKYVTVLDLTDNWIDNDGCFHLGEMLIVNTALQVLVLEGCRIGPKGAKRMFKNLHINRSLRELNLSHNQLSDEGVEYLTRSILMGAEVTNINLTYNSLTDASVLYFVDILDGNNKITHLNFSWNNIKSVNAVYSMCSKLAQNKSFLELNLSWNGLSGAKAGKAVEVLLRNENFRHLYFSNNKLNDIAVKPVVAALTRGSNLVTLDLSYNPLTLQAAYNLLEPMTFDTTKLQNLLLDGITVTSEFIKLRDKVLYEKNAVITYGKVIPQAISKDIDLKDLVLNRLDYISKNQKKQSVDIALLIMELYEMNKAPMENKFLLKALKVGGVPMEMELLEQLFSLFRGPPKPKSQTVDIAAIREFCKRKWPDRKLPPKELQPEPEPLPAKKSKKKSKKK